MHIQEITITHVPAAPGSNRVAWNVDLDGRPFGQIWTFKAPGERHRFHVAGAAGYDCFTTYAEAERAIRGQM